MALDILTSSVIGFLAFILCSRAQHFFSNSKGYMWVHTCARTYIHTWIWNIYVLFHFIILFFIGPKKLESSCYSQRKREVHGISSSLLASLCWDLCWTWLLVVQSAFVGTERVIWEVWQARKGGLSLWAIWMPQGYPRETMLITGA